MTDTERNTAIKKLVADYTAANTKDRQTARKSLINEGIYTKKGNLRAEFGGEPKKEKTAA